MPNAADPGPRRRVALARGALRADIHMSKATPATSRPQSGQAENRETRAVRDWIRSDATPVEHRQRAARDYPLPARPPAAPVTRPWSVRRSAGQA